MAGGRFSGLLRRLFQVGINIRLGWWDKREVGEVGREEEKPPYRHFGVAMAIWGGYKAPNMSRRCLWSNGSSFRSWLPYWCHPEVPFS